MLVSLILAVATALSQSAPPALEDFAARLDFAREHYDLEAADAVRAGAARLVESKPDPATKLLAIEAALLSAELRRIDWERLPESNVADRRPLGTAIDEAAEEGLALLEPLGPTSETYRLKADLLAVMIRSDYRAKKYRKDMEAAAAKAVELDQANAKAYVSQAKPFIFAKPNEGGDPMRAVDLLTKALELDPTLETARCLRGLAYKEAGQPDAARADWALALKRNPDCRPAKDELAALDQ